MHRRDIILVTPALASANNGNWQTAQRWARLLAPAYRVTLTDRADAAMCARAAGPRTSPTTVPRTSA